MGPTEADYGNNVSGATGDAGPWLFSLLFLATLPRNRAWFKHLPSSSISRRAGLRGLAVASVISHWLLSSSRGSLCLAVRLCVSVGRSDGPPFVLWIFHRVCARARASFVSRRRSARRRPHTHTHTHTDGIRRWEGQCLAASHRKRRIFLSASSFLFVLSLSRRVSETISPDSADFADLGRHNSRAWTPERLFVSRDASPSAPGQCSFYPTWSTRNRESGRVFGWRPTPIGPFRPSTMEISTAFASSKHIVIVIIVIMLLCRYCRCTCRSSLLARRISERTIFICRFDEPHFPWFFKRV